LAPGRVNHHQISALTGKWKCGTVKGKLMSTGWGAAVGFPGLILDPLGPSVDVHLFELNRPICLHTGGAAAVISVNLTPKLFPSSRTPRELIRTEFVTGRPLHRVIRSIASNLGLTH